MSNNIFDEIQKILMIWQIELNLEYTNPEKNVKVSFGDIGSFGELLAINFNPGFIGSGSGGMGFDLLNLKTGKAIECKTCSTIQNSKCTECGLKLNDLFLSECPNCKNTKLKKISDSRFGINSKELLRQLDSDILEKLSLCHISLKGQNKINKTIDINLSWYDIRVDDPSEYGKIRLQYFINQATKGKNTTANLLPNSYDFFKLTPIKIFEIDATINYSDISIKPLVKFNDKAYYPRITEKLVKFTKAELPYFRGLKSYDPKTKSADAFDFTINMDYRDKSLGKDRGDTREGMDRIFNR